MHTYTYTYRERERKREREREAVIFFFVRHQYGTPWYPIPEALSWPQQAGRLVDAQPPTRAATNAMKDPGLPHPRNDQPPPFHIGRRPRSTQLAQAPATKTKGFCSALPVLPGLDVDSPLSPRVSHTKVGGNPALGGAAAAPTRRWQVSWARFSPHTPC